MRKRLLILAVLTGVVFSAGPKFAFAVESSESINFEILKASNTTAVSLTASKYVASTSYGVPCGALITVEDADVRVRTDGTAASSTSGHKITAGSAVTLDSQADLGRFSAAAVTTTSTGTLIVTYWTGCR